MADESTLDSAGWHPSADDPAIIGYWNGRDWSAYRHWDGTEWKELEIDSPLINRSSFISSGPTSIETDQGQVDPASSMSDAEVEPGEPKDLASASLPSVAPRGLTSVPVGIASLEQKQQVVRALKNANSKYAKPFEKGKMANVSFMGGNWENYAQIVMEMVSADTLLQIQGQLETLNRNIDVLISRLSD